ncbi:energy transducer TonB [Labilibacter sediminis]|nr:energy transducer TonB [Labilibacter sediminis]
MKTKYLFYIILFSFHCLFLSGQETRLVKRYNGQFLEEYLVLKSDTSIKNGRYIRKYKNDVIERGAYKLGKKTGRWVYFSFEGVFEFEYDYHTNKIVKISGKHKPEDYFETPIFFHGSPLIPYLYMARNIQYPIEAKKHDINGKVTLALKIDSNGQIHSLYLKKKLHPLLDKEVIKVAKTFPNNWKWVPATYNGKKINSEYQIDIEFELVADSTN